MPRIRRTLYIANWKMHKTEFEARAYLGEFLQQSWDTNTTDVAIAPPFTSLRTAGEMIQGSPIALAAQNVHWESSGPYTGEVSARMLADLSVRYVLVGHSERRLHFGETDERIGRKARAASEAGMVPVVCVGESQQQRDSGRTEPVIESQLRLALSAMTFASGSEAVIAYEPVWAIGTGRTASPEQVDSAHLFLREVLASVSGEAAARHARILYGGSVSPASIEPISALPEVDGFLVGGASLEPVTFLQLVRAGGAR